MFKIQNFISNEKVALLSALGKNYPEVLTQKWASAKPGETPRIQNFMQASIDKIERKKQAAVLKIIEDWLKNYQTLNQQDNNDEKVIAEAARVGGAGLVCPYDNPVFCRFLADIMEDLMLSQEVVYEAKYFQGPQAVTGYQLGLEINTTIQLLNIVCIINSDQYLKVFKTKE